MAARYDFASDNVAGAMPEVLGALAGFNSGFAAGYGEDEICIRASELIRGLLDVDAEVRFAASGTAANALTLAALAEPHEAVLAHEHSHLATDETGAPGFFGAGMGVIPLAGASGRIDPGALKKALQAPDQPHWQSPAALSLTNATEYGAVYSHDALAELIEPAKSQGLKIHLDGARLANAVAAGFEPSVLGRLGVDVVVLGGTKAGSTPTEAIVLIDKTLSRRFGARLKHAGQLVSKARFLAAPWIGMLEDGAWRTRADHANAMARRLALACPLAVTHPVEANAVFVAMDEATLTRLHQSGWFVYRFIDGSVRFMCSWATTAESVDELATALKAVAESPTPPPPSPAPRSSPPAARE
ncbi:MAG TPA: beta-eliminating lyase-related protein [Caulobacteraceae bacterium]